MSGICWPSISCVFSLYPTFYRSVHPAGASFIRQPWLTSRLGWQSTLARFLNWWPSSGYHPGFNCRHEAALQEYRRFLTFSPQLGTSLTSSISLFVYSTFSVGYRCSAKQQMCVAVQALSSAVPCRLCQMIHLILHNLIHNIWMLLSVLWQLHPHNISTNLIVILDLHFYILEQVFTTGKIFDFCIILFGSSQRPERPALVKCWPRLDHKEIKIWFETALLQKRWRCILKPVKWRTVETAWYFSSCTSSVSSY